MDHASGGSKTNIQECIKKLNRVHRQRLGFIGPYVGMFLIILFAFFLLPLFLYLLFFNHFYFWIRRQKRIEFRPYVNYDRHRIAHLSFMDRVWCEYCEWANGTLQWALAITNEIERRYCPIKNHCDPHCGKAKEWRADFLSYGHQVEDVERYYQERYLQESRLDDH